MENHSDELLEVIRRITNDQVVAAVQAAEPRATGDDVFKKITYRTAVADFYAKRLP